MSAVFLLWFKGKHDIYLFGAYSSVEKATAAQKLYESSGKCDLDSGYFQPIQAVEVDKNLSEGYLPRAK